MVDWISHINSYGTTNLAIIREKVVFEQKGNGKSFVLIF